MDAPGSTPHTRPRASRTPDHPAARPQASPGSTSRCHRSPLERSRAGRRTPGSPLLRTGADPLAILTAQHETRVPETVPIRSDYEALLVAVADGRIEAREGI